MFQVGQRTLELHDPARRDWSNSGPRPLLTELWYPAADTAQSREMWQPPDFPSAATR